MNPHSPDMTVPLTAEAFFPPDRLPVPSGQDDASICETEAILIAVAQAVEQRDHHTARHCERLALTSVALGMALRLDRVNLIALYRGGFLHDVGKVGIPDAILFKPNRLTAEEWVVMRSHTIRGEDICRHVKALKPVLPIIRHHHERWDGSGYPDGLRGQQIPLLARVLQIADIYDALTSPRPYKPAFSVNQALRIIEQETNRGWRDPQIVKLFFELHPAVISRIDQLSFSEEGHFAAMHGALASLGDALNAGNPTSAAPANDHMSSRLPQSERLAGSRQAAEDRWRMA